MTKAPDMRPQAARAWWGDHFMGDGLYWLVLLLTAVLAVSTLVSPWDIDEGVISLFTAQFQETGDLRYLFQHHNARFSFSWPYFYLLAAVRGNALDPDTYYLLRLPSVVLCVLSLVAVNESLRAFVNSRAVRSLALVFFAAACLQLGGVHARYDSPYLFGASMALLTVARLHQGRSWLWACPGLLAAVFAATSHPVGLGALAFVGFALAYYFFVRRPAGLEAAVVLGTALVGAGLLIAGLLIDRTPGEFLADLKQVQDQYHTFTSSTVSQEVGRYRSELQSGGLIAKIFVTSILCGLVWPVFARRCAGIRCCRAGLWLLVIFLALIPTKWHFYLALLLPCATVLGAYHFQALCQLKIFVARRGLRCADDCLAVGRFRLSQVIALGLAAYLAVGICREGWRSAGTNTLFVRLAWPQSPQAEQARKISELVAGKSINLYSDLRIAPLL